MIFIWKCRFYFVSLAKLNPQTQNHIMKTFLQFATLLAVLLMLAGVIVSCENNEKQHDYCTPTELNWIDCTSIRDSFVVDSSASIVGKWKLQKVQHHFGACFDYSLCDIVYEFRANGTLVVSGSSWVKRQGHSPLGHRIGRPYSYTPTNTHKGAGYQVHTNTIFNHAFAVSMDRMLTTGVVDSDLTVDGPIFIFIRINPLARNGR